MTSTLAHRDVWARGDPCAIGAERSPPGEARGIHHGRRSRAITTLDDGIERFGRVHPRRLLRRRRSELGRRWSMTQARRGGLRRLGVLAEEREGRRAFSGRRRRRRRLFFHARSRCGTVVALGVAVVGEEVVAVEVLEHLGLRLHCRVDGSWRDVVVVVGSFGRLEWLDQFL